MEHHVLSGEVSIGDLLSTLDVENFDNLKDRYNWLLDFRQAKLNATADELRQLGFKLREHRQNNTEDRVCKMAALAKDDVTYGLLRVFIVYASCEKSNLHVCRSESEARSFLDLDAA